MGDVGKKMAERLTLWVGSSGWVTHSGRKTRRTPKLILDEGEYGIIKRDGYTDSPGWNSKPIQHPTRYMIVRLEEADADGDRKATVLYDCAPGREWREVVAWLKGLAAKLQTGEVRLNAEGQFENARGKRIPMRKKASDDEAG